LKINKLVVFGCKGTLVTQQVHPAMLLHLGNCRAKQPLKRKDLCQVNFHEQVRQTSTPGTTAANAGANQRHAADTRPWRAFLSWFGKTDRQESRHNRGRQRHRKGGCNCLCPRSVEEFGGVDILVNNAAHQASFESIEDISDEEWEITFKTNTHSMFYLTKAAVPHMKEGGTIINTASINADAPNPMPAQGAVLSKHATA
jgi:NAD(P)-dependent dehydrogenase (short-subunit alcohol dehydrogenase family)